MIFVRRCFALCTTKLGQYTSSLSICSSAVEYRFERRTRSHCRRGACARSGVLIYKYTTPSFSRTVAYRELARGHDCRLHRPVRLYSLRQNVWCVDDLILYEQKWCPMSDHTTSSDCIVTVASKKSRRDLSAPEPGGGRPGGYEGGGGRLRARTSVDRYTSAYRCTSATTTSQRRAMRTSRKRRTWRHASTPSAGTSSSCAASPNTLRSCAARTRPSISRAARP